MRLACHAPMRLGPLGAVLGLCAALAAVLVPRGVALAQRPPGFGHNQGVNPNAQLSGQVHLPILDFIGQDDVCSSWVEVQNIGCEYAMAAMIVGG